MNDDEARTLPLGLYRVHWRSGGTSLASVGMRDDGSRWLAPINWTQPTLTPNWDAVGRMEPVPLERDPGLAAVLEDKVRRLEQTLQRYDEHVGTSLALGETPMRLEAWLRSGGMGRKG